jgi:dihydroneopterin aldolase
LPKYTIYIHSLTFEAIVGILEDERQTPQQVIVDATITYERESEEFINYAEVAAMIESAMQKEQFFLLEEALEVLCKKIKHTYVAITSIKLKISKPDILENCLVAVEIFKKY